MSLTVSELYDIPSPFMTNCH